MTLLSLLLLSCLTLSFAGKFDLFSGVFSGVFPGVFSAVFSAVFFGHFLTCIF